MTKNFYINKELGFQLLLYILWSYNTILKYCSILIGKIPFLGSSFSSIFLSLVLFIAIILGIRYVVCNIRKLELVLYLGIVIISLVTILIGSKMTVKFNDYCICFLVFMLPLFWIGKSFYYLLKDNDNILISFTNISVCAVIATLLIYSISGNGHLVSESWMSNQYFPYLLLPHLALLALRTFSQKNPIYFFTTISGYIFMLLCGNRWSVFCLSFFIMILVIHYTAKMKKQFRFVIIGALIILLFFVFMGNYFDLLIEKLNDLSSAMGMSTRTLSFLTGTSTQEYFDSSRSIIQRKIISAIFDNPFGYGFCSDWYFVNMYSHNVFLELILEHGFFLGGFVCLWILYTIIKAIIQSKEWQIRSVIWLLFSVSILKLMISGTYLDEPFFYILLGFCVEVIYDTNHNKVMQRIADSQCVKGNK